MKRIGNSSLREKRGKGENGLERGRKEVEEGGEERRKESTEEGGGGEKRRRGILANSAR
ncbi:hypothetical protein [Streptococcus pyogenes]|uniref:hypothetical protein n=1 Tax=Streptococcus pyogenes TaxID=1314 RepID=UPI00165312A3|nr:hypothetical protein [Streptococcus pyogenes]